MTKDNTNPFVLPGFGQSGDAAQNPLIASMEMMRSAWEGLAKVGGFDQVLGSNVSAQDLEKRIADLRAVEQWLRMNLSMLSSTIQALEVQQATVSTINNFLSTVSTSTSDITVPPSPLEVALGIRPSGAAQPESQPEQPSSSTADTVNTSEQSAKSDDAKSEPKPSSKPASGDSTGLFTNPTETIQQANEAVQAAQQAQIEQVSQASQVAEDATKRWWGLLQNQFDTLAQAATATVQGANLAAGATATTTKATAKKPAAKKATTKKPAAKKASTKKTTKQATKKASATKATAKTATKATATKKVAAKKATAKKSASKIGKKA